MAYDINPIYYYDESTDPPYGGRTKRWRKYTKGPHLAKLTAKRRAKNKVAKKTRRMQRRKRK